MFINDFWVICGSIIWGNMGWTPLLAVSLCSGVPSSPPKGDITNFWQKSSWREGLWELWTRPVFPILSGVTFPFQKSIWNLWHLWVCLEHRKNIQTLPAPLPHLFKVQQRTQKHKGSVKLPLVNGSHIRKTPLYFSPNYLNSFPWGGKTETHFKLYSKIEVIWHPTAFRHRVSTL